MVSVPGRRLQVAHARKRWKLPLRRGWGNYFRTGNAAKCFNKVDLHVWRRLHRLVVKRNGRHLQPNQALRWSRDYFESFGLHRLRCTVRYPEAA